MQNVDKALAKGTRKRDSHQKSCVRPTHERKSKKKPQKGNKYLAMDHLASRRTYRGEDNRLKAGRRKYRDEGK